MPSEREILAADQEEITEEDIVVDTEEIEEIIETTGTIEITETTGITEVDETIPELELDTTTAEDVVTDLDLHLVEITIVAIEILAIMA